MIDLIFKGLINAIVSALPGLCGSVCGRPRLHLQLRSVNGELIRDARGHVQLYFHGLVSCSSVFSSVSAKDVTTQVSRICSADSSSRLKWTGDYQLSWQYPGNDNRIKAEIGTNREICDIFYLDLSECLLHVCTQDFTYPNNMPGVIVGPCDLYISLYAKSTNAKSNVLNLHVVWDGCSEETDILSHISVRKVKKVKVV